MRDYDDLPYIVIERRSAGLAPFLWGAVLGAGAALLLAPRSGAQTQEDIRRGVQRARSVAEDRVEAARSTYSRTRERFEDGIESVRGGVDTVREQFENVRDRFETRADQARETLDTGRRIAHDAREEIERRVEEARDAYHTAGEKVGLGHEAPPSGTGGPDVVVIDVAEERSEGRSDLG
jgi:gas vesicle protein